MTATPSRPGRKYQRPSPANFLEIATGRSINHVRRITGAHHETVQRWFAEHGLTSCPEADRTKKAPEGFAEKAATMSNRKLSEEFGLCMKVVARLRAESGVVYERQKPKAKPTRLFIRGPKPAPLGLPDISLLGRAADHLRRIGWVVTRRNSAGHFDPKGDHYRVGNMPLMSADEMLSFADRKGFSQMERAA